MNTMIVFVLLLLSLAVNVSLHFYAERRFELGYRLGYGGAKICINNLFRGREGAESWLEFHNQTALEFKQAFPLWIAAQLDECNKSHGE